MRGRAGYVAAGTVAAGVLAGGLVWWQSSGDDATEPTCGVQTAAVARPEPGLLPVADLLPSGSVGDERRPIVTAADEVAAELGLGEVVSGRFHDTALDVPGLVPLDAALPGAVLLASPSADGQLLTAVRLPEGEAVWAREFGTPMRGGGLVGDLLVVLTGGDVPGVLILDPADGAVHGCVVLDEEVSTGDVRVLADQAGPEIVLALGSGGVTVHDVDPASASIGWSRRLTALTEAATLTVVPDEDGAVVVVGAAGPDPVLLGDLAGTDAAGSLEAVGLADGAPAWTYPEDGSAVGVVDAGEDGTLVLLSAGRDPQRPQRPPTLSVVALDAGGTELWRRRLGREPVGLELWGDTVVVRGDDGSGRPALRGHALATGQPTWRLTSPAAPDGSDGGLGGGTALGDRYVVTAPGGLLAIDPRSGEHRLVRTDLLVDQLLPVGDLVVLRSGAALLVVGPV